MDPVELIAHWGYLALFLLVVLGNIGVAPAWSGTRPGSSVTRTGSP